MIVHEMAQYLDDQGLVTYDPTGAAGGGNVFVPSYVGIQGAPDAAILIRPTGGLRSDSKRIYDDPTVQIIVRSTTDPMPGMTLAQAIYDALHGFHGGPFVTGGIWVVGCVGLQSAPAYIGVDANGRHEFSLNFQMHTKTNGRL